LVGQHGRRQGAGQDRAEVDNTDAVERRGQRIQHKFLKIAKEVKLT
jgi:hypothetical protein